MSKFMGWCCRVPWLSCHTIPPTFHKNELLLMQYLKQFRNLLPIPVTFQRINAGEPMVARMSDLSDFGHSERSLGLTFLHAR